MMKKTRFTKPMYSTRYFSKDILVKCPKCTGKCHVITDFLACETKSILRCEECGYASNNEEWFGYSVGIAKIYCGFCGTKLDYCTKPTKEPYEKTFITCQKCNTTKEYPLKWSQYKDEAAIDPYFGLELWLQIAVKNNNLWVYNLDHLNYLKEYIISDLREDDTRCKYSIVTKLPKCIKSSKNRDLIIKKLNKLAEY